MELDTGNLEPLPARDMAVAITRWRRVRASPAVLANGPGAHRLPTAADGSPG